LNLLLFGDIVITSEIDFSQFFCWNEDCSDYGIKNQGNIVLKEIYGKNRDFLLFSGLHIFFSHRAKQ